MHAAAARLVHNEYTAPRLCSTLHACEEDGSDAAVSVIDGCLESLSMGVLSREQSPYGDSDGKPPVANAERKKTAAEQYVQSFADLLTEMQSDMEPDQWSSFMSGAALGDVEDDEEDVLREERKRRIREKRAAP